MDWSTGLQSNGTYYEGWVDNLDEVLSSHAKATMTCYGTRRSSKSRFGNTSPIDKENISTDIQQKVKYNVEIKLIATLIFDFHPTYPA